jgi:CheY-like chemotaxis protein
MMSSSPEISNEPYILIAEDDAGNMDVFSTYLENFGFRCVWAKNGQEAVQYAEREKPALILMDIQMPVMDGLEAIGLIRQNPSLQSVPIIALTAMAMQGDKDRCLNAGATDYVSKPVKLKELLATVQRYFGSENF